EPPAGEGERACAPGCLRILRLAEDTVDPGPELRAGALHFGDALGQVAGDDVAALVQDDQEQLVLRSEMPVEELAPEGRGVPEVPDRRGGGARGGGAPPRGGAKRPPVAPPPPPPPPFAPPPALPP